MLHMSWFHDDLEHINSMTKYPSIPTYHTIGNKGLLQEENLAFEGKVEVFEKIDGTNSRVIILPDGNYMIGSREELLHFGSDMLWNTELGIVEVIKPIVEANKLDTWGNGEIKVIYLETFGGKIQAKAARNYTSKNETSCRMFDFAVFPKQLWRDMIEWSMDLYSGWRERGNTPFVSTSDLKQIAIDSGIKMTPFLGSMDSKDLPQTLEDTYEWMKKLLPHSYVALDDRAQKQAEGVVIRTPDRKIVAKARFKDYERTLRKKIKGQGND